MSTCICPSIDGYRIRSSGGCPIHGEEDARVSAEKAAERASEERDRNAEDAACDWSDFRKDYGVSGNPDVRKAERRAFLAGWEAGRNGDQSGPQR